MRLIGCFATATLAAAAIACGGGDDVAPSGAAESAALAEAPAAERSAAAPGRNHVPIIKSVRLEPAAPIDGDRVAAVVAIEDQDGDPVRLGFEWSISGRAIAGGEPWIELRGVTKRDRIEVRVTASDGKETAAPATAEARVQNRRPAVTGVAVTPHPEVIPGELLVATARASDPDGDPVTYRFAWRVNGQERPETGDTLDTAGLGKGDRVQAVVVANDGSVDSAEVASVVVNVANSHPEITSVPNGTWTRDGFSYSVEARDPDNDVPLRYALRSGPKGMRVDSVLGKVSWQPTSDQTGVHPVEIAVSDALGATSIQVFEITVKAEEEPAPPASARR